MCGIFSLRFTGLSSSIAIDIDVVEICFWFVMCYRKSTWLKSFVTLWSGMPHGRTPLCQICGEHISIKKILVFHVKPIKWCNLQSWTKYLNKIEKFSKIGQDNKSLISTFACFLTAITMATAIKFNFWKEIWALVSTVTWEFSNISQFSKILTLK